MKIILAEEMGFCFGVRDALDLTKTIKNPETITVWGELVHNPLINKELKERGFIISGEKERTLIPDTKNVLITAHGISDQKRQWLIQEGKNIIDTTCPLVKRVHEIALKMQRQGFFIIIIGKRNHVEIQGITGDLTFFDVVSLPEEIKTYPYPRIAILCQTTFPPRLLEEMLQKIHYLNPDTEISFIDTICHPTKERQDAVEKLLKKVQALIVVGGKHSNNTLQLVQLARDKKTPYLHVESADDLNLEWCRKFEVIGLTAGTSALDQTIREVQQKLESFINLDL